MLVWVKRPHNFKYGTGLSAVYAKWHWSIWYQIVSVSWLSSKKNITLLSYDCKTSFANKNIGSFTSCLGIAVNKGSPRELVRKLNFSLFFSCSIQNKLVIGLLNKKLIGWSIWPKFWEDNLILFSVSKMNIKASKTSKYNITCTDTEMRFQWAMQIIIQ